MVLAFAAPFSSCFSFEACAMEIKITTLEQTYCKTSIFGEKTQTNVSMACRQCKRFATNVIDVALVSKLGELVYKHSTVSVGFFGLSQGVLLFFHEY